MKYINLEYHPCDSRIRIVDDDVSQTLNQRMGTGGGNVPLILCFSKKRRARDKDDFETWERSETSNTINAFDVGDKRATDIIVTK